MSAAERIDKWLWHARIVKTRGLAQKLIERGQVRLNALLVVKPSAPVRAGDNLAITLGAVQRHLTVRGTGERRGPPAEARALYEEPQPPQRLSSEEAALPLYKSATKNQR